MDELSSPWVKDQPFETCLLQRSGEAWDTRDLRSGPSVALSSWVPVTERLAVFRTRRGPKWAGWVKGSATSGLKAEGFSRGSSAANTASNPSYHIVESWDIEKMMEEPPTDFLRSSVGGLAEEASASRFPPDRPPGEPGGVPGQVYFVRFLLRHQQGRGGSGRR